MAKYRLVIEVADDDNHRRASGVRGILKSAARLVEGYVKDVDDLYVRNIDVVEVL